MEGEDVFGCKISLQYSPARSLAGIGSVTCGFAANDMMTSGWKRCFASFPPPPDTARVAPPKLFDMTSRVEDHQVLLVLRPWLWPFELGFWYFCFWRTPIGCC